MAKHNYTSELELKSLLIRIKNKREGMTDESRNSRINKYIKWHTSIGTKKPTAKVSIKNNIVALSEKTASDDVSFERFGEIILLMIKNILKKPQFSGYTYRDDFYSDATYKILKYLHNFDHTKISKVTNTSVNAFAYISQIIHNSIIFIINTKKKENENLKKLVRDANLSLQSRYVPEADVKHKEEEVIHIKTIRLNDVRESLVKEIEGLGDISEFDRVNLYYPADYVITFNEYEKLKPLLRCKINIMRSDV